MQQTRMQRGVFPPISPPRGYAIMPPNFWPRPFSQFVIRKILRGKNLDSLETSNNWHLRGQKYLGKSIRNAVKVPLDSRMGREYENYLDNWQGR